MFEETELYKLVYQILSQHISPDSYEERTFVKQIAVVVSTEIQVYMSDLEESIAHLKETIKRLSKD